MIPVILHASILLTGDSFISFGRVAFSSRAEQLVSSSSFLHVFLDDSCMYFDTTSVGRRGRPDDPAKVEVEIESHVWAIA